MELTLQEAREELFTLVRTYDLVLTDSQRTALALADSALKTIIDDYTHAPIYKGDTND